MAIPFLNPRGVSPRLAILQTLLGQIGHLCPNHLDFVISAFFLSISVQNRW